MLGRLPRPFAILFALLFAAAAAWCLTTPPGQVSRAASGHYTDMMLQRDIVSAMRRGVPYYQAATQTQRAHGYPTRPFVTVREPALSWLAATLGWGRLNTAEYVLLIANALLWPLALPRPAGWLERIGAGIGIALGGLAAVASTITPMAEAWCGLLLSLALGLTLWRRAGWWLPLVAIAAALALRELALPFVLLAAAFAAYERRWKQLAAWALVAAVFAGGMIIHAAKVAEFALASDLPSQGWSGGLGLRGVLLALVHTTALHLLPKQAALLIALLPVLGWGALDGRGGRFAALLLGGYALLLALFARSDNFYWGFLMLPVWFAGLALVPRGVWQLGRAIVRPAVRPAIRPPR